MAHLTPIPWRKFEKFLLAVGCEFRRQVGDHRIYSRADLKRPIVLVTVKDLPIFIIRNNLRVLSISPEEYLDILDRL